MLGDVSFVSQWWAVVLLVSFVLFVLPAGLLFDQLVRYHYLHHRERWEADGHPRGIFWSAPDALRSEEDFLCYGWFWQTPLWIANNGECRRKLRIFRSLIMCEIVVAIGVAATLSI